MDATLTLTHFLVSHNHLTNHNPKLSSMTSSMTSSQTMSKKRTIKPEPDSSTSDSNSPSPETPSKKARSTSTPTKTTSPKKSSTKADAWTPELRLKLFEAYESSSQVKWDEVARKVGASLSCWLTRRWETVKMHRRVGSSGSVLPGRKSRLHLRRRARIQRGRWIGSRA
jgi:hypothetical protein